MSDPVGPPATFSAISHWLFCAELWIQFTSGRNMSHTKKEERRMKDRGVKKGQKNLALVFDWLLFQQNWPTIFVNRNCSCVA